VYSHIPWFYDLRSGTGFRVALERGIAIKSWRPAFGTTVATGKLLVRETRNSHVPEFQHPTRAITNSLISQDDHANKKTNQSETHFQSIDFLCLVNQALLPLRDRTQFLT